MPIQVTCECGRQFQAKDENVGRRFSCPNCGRELVVPKGSDDPYASPMSYERLESGTSGKAIASLVLGLLSFLCFFFTGIPAIILGAMGLSDIGKRKGLTGKGLAIAGIVTGAIGSVFFTIIILIALLLPAVQAAREAARRSQCVNNLKQIGLAMHNYASTNNTFPAAAITAPDGTPLLSWRVAILPYLEQESLYRQFKLDEPWDSPTNKPLIARMPNVYLCPSDGPNVDGSTRYQVIVGPGSLFEGAKGSAFQDITDGTSNTLLATEAGTPVEWTKPEDVNIANIVGALQSKHPRGVNVLMADGSVKFLKVTTDPTVLNAIATRAGGEVVSSDAF